VGEKEGRKEACAGLGPQRLHPVGTACPPAPGRALFRQSARLHLPHRVAGKRSSSLAMPAVRVARLSRALDLSALHG
jgi:hypothetical protein